MIRQVYSSLRSFKTLNFHGGLNIVLVSKSPDATYRQTRNKAGKTSFLELIHLFLGGDIDKKCLICEEKLSNYVFGMKFDVGSQEVNVERSCKTKSKVIFNENFFNNWPTQPKWDSNAEKFILRNEVWKELLGYLMFNLEYHDRPKEKQKYTTTFRSLISYFARRENVGGFREPECNSTDQQLWDSQIAISYLIGFDWNVPYQFQQVRLREKTVREIKKLLSGQVGLRGIDSIGDLRTKSTITERSMEKLKKELKEFRVLETYHDLENEVNGITRKVSEIIDESLLDKEYLSTLQSSLESEEPPNIDEIINIYKEAVSEILPMVKKKLDDAREFYETIIDNRKLYLEGEITVLQNRIERKEASIKSLESRKAEIMNILNSHGALEQYTELQLELARLKTSLEEINNRIQTLEQLSEEKSEAKLERAKLEIMLKKNYNEQAETYKKAIDTFEDISSQFYENPGSLVIDPTPNGPKFNVKIQGERSKGIKNIQIFCFDMMLMKILKDRDSGPDFLIHDSHLFDGVDARQIATALKIGKELSEELGFQYIVTMNSDVFQSMNAMGIDFSDFVIPVDLTDKTETGGLFGLKF